MGSAMVQPSYGQPTAKSATLIKVDITRTYQVVENFAASDAWSCQFIGHWPAVKKNAIADWLFSTDTLKDGSPKGIGLSLWRFNIGAGSARQGDSSGIRDEWRRTESFLDADGRYDPEAQSGQRWFLQAARARGVTKFLGFLNSPPVWLTRTGKAYATDGRTNIDSGRYMDFAAYIARVIKGIKAGTGINLDYLSPVNEPQWDWSDGGQEGCPYNNREVYGLVETLSRSFVSAGLSTRILVPESGNVKYLLTNDDKPGKGGQIDAFFRPGSPSYIGNLPNVGRTIAAHSYWSTMPWQSGIGLRERISAHIDSLNKRFHGRSKLNYWQSEFCILGESGAGIKGEKRDTGMEAALYMARVIHNDLVYANAAAWQWWLAISPYDYKDGLIYTDRNKTDGNYWDSRKLWALGNFSRFIRPGMQRIAAGFLHPEEEAGLLVSAYKDAAHRRLVVVFINTNKDDRDVSLGTVAAPEEKTMGSAAGWSLYVTGETESLRKLQVSPNWITLKSRSISTLTGNY